MLNSHKRTFPSLQKVLLETQRENVGPSHWTLTQDKSFLYFLLVWGLPQSIYIKLQHLDIWCLFYISHDFLSRHYFSPYLSVQMSILFLWLWWLAGLCWFFLFTWYWLGSLVRVSCDLESPRWLHLHTGHFSWDDWNGWELVGSFSVLYYSSTLVSPHKQVKAAIPLKEWA